MKIIKSEDTIHKFSQNITENNFLSYSRYIENQGIKFFELAKKENLEGLVAKKKSSKYYFGKRTSEWLKIKVMFSDIFLLLGYIKEKDMKYVFGKYEADSTLKDYGSIYGSNSYEKKKS